MSREMREREGKMRISVIVPAYNVAPYIEECLSSIQIQEGVDLELFVVDDGSTDGTLAIVNSYAENDARITVIEQPHSNAGAARNLGMERATGDYLLFFDSDDYMFPGMLAALARRAQETDADIVCCRAFSFDDETGDIVQLDLGVLEYDEGRIYSGAELSAHVFQRFVGWPWDKLFKRSFVEAQGLRFQEIASTNDARFVFCGLILADTVAFVSERLVAHRSRAGSIEKSRCKTPHNALRAAEAIKEFLQEKGVWERAASSHGQWRLEFLYWNWRTLELEARREIEKDIHRIVSAADFDADSFERTDGVRFALLGTQLEIEGLSYYEIAEGVVTAKLLDDVWEGIRRQEQQRIHDAQLYERDVRILTLEAELKELREVRESTSFKLGWTLTAFPRKLKDSLGTSRCPECVLTPNP